MASEMAPAAGTFAREESELDPLTQPYIIVLRILKAVDHPVEFVGTAKGSDVRLTGSAGIGNVGVGTCPSSCFARCAAITRWREIQVWLKRTLYRVGWRDRA